MSEIKKCIGIISYLSDNAEARAARKTRLEKLIQKCTSLFDLPIIIIAQNWHKNEVSVNSHCTVYKYDHALGITPARELLREKLLESEYDYFILLDDDCIIEGDDATEYFHQIDLHPYGYGTFNGSMLKLFAISRFAFEKSEFPKVNAIPLEGYEIGNEDIIYCVKLRLDVPGVDFTFIGTGLYEHSDADIGDNNESSWLGELGDINIFKENVKQIKKLIRKHNGKE